MVLSLANLVTKVQRENGEIHAVLYPNTDGTLRYWAMQSDARKIISDFIPRCSPCMDIQSVATSNARCYTGV